MILCTVVTFGKCLVQFYLCIILNICSSSVLANISKQKRNIYLNGSFRIHSRVQCVIVRNFKLLGNQQQLQTPINSKYLPPVCRFFIKIEKFHYSLNADIKLLSARYPMAFAKHYDADEMQQSDQHIYIYQWCMNFK